MIVALALALAAVASAPPSALTPKREATAPEFVAALPDGAVLSVKIVADRPLLTISGMGPLPAEYEVSDRDTVLRILADDRLSPLWPVLLDWAGPRLERVRGFALPSLREAYRKQRNAAAPVSSAESTVRPAARAALQLAAALVDAGYRDEAVALIIAEREARKARKSDWQRIEYVTFTVRLSTMMHLSGRSSEAISLLESEARLGNEPYGINLDVNRAAFLAETGRFAESLALVDAISHQFDATQDGDYGRGGEKLPGSARQFDWIRACALAGLGRSGEAAPLIAALRTAPDPTDNVFVPAPGAQLRMRAAICMRDRDAMVRELLDDLTQSSFANAALIWLQPSLTPPFVEQRFLDEVRGDARLIAATEGRLRVLPADLTPALNAWRAPRASITVAR